MLSPNTVVSENEFRPVRERRLLKLRQAAQGKILVLRIPAIPNRRIRIANSVRSII